MIRTNSLGRGEERRGREGRGGEGRGEERRGEERRGEEGRGGEGRGEERRGGEGRGGEGRGEHVSPLDCFWLLQYGGWLAPPLGMKPSVHSAGGGSRAA